MDSTEAYESKAIEFLRSRDQSPIGKNVVSRWARQLKCGASVIELGCGGGFPITFALHSTGLRLWAVDSSPTLVAEFQSRFPDVPVQCDRVQESRFFSRKYNAAIAVGLIFLLSEPDQCALISRIANILLPGGRFLLTAPIETGSWVDVNTGLVCNSLGQMVYEDLFSKAGFRTLSTFTDAGENNYYDIELIS
ncbi:MAG: class I SAM-dependent methyltransferase [Granulosicoccus sp.]|nr:class I SAM-dependent methyltransferase [Granulosicoccus sp.]